VINQGFKIANFVDTSGNPPASKVYRAAKIILSQEGIDGYFASGSGVASQEQFHSARGLVKAFMEEPLALPAVIRLGGNAEDLAIKILQRAQPEFSARVEGYGKDVSPDHCASRLKALVDAKESLSRQSPGFIENQKKHHSSFQFNTVTGGTISFDYQKCSDCQTKICISSCVPKILSLENDLPVLNISKEEAARGKCSECLACEIECYFEGNRGGKIDLPLPNLEVE
jgi:NAD-dependent dihydropyrimidine dehydrogenase PreA subunit